MAFDTQNSQSLHLGARFQNLEAEVLHHVAPDHGNERFVFNQQDDLPMIGHSVVLSVGASWVLFPATSGMRL